MQEGGAGGVGRAGTQPGLAELVASEAPDVSEKGVRCGGGRLHEEAGAAGSNTGVEGVGRITDPRWQFKESPLSR